MCVALGSSQLHGAKVSSGSGLSPYRDLDEAAHLTESGAAELFDFPSASNIQHRPIHTTRPLNPDPLTPVALHPNARFTDIAPTYFSLPGCYLSPALSMHVSDLASPRKTLNRGPVVPVH